MKNFSLTTFAFASVIGFSPWGQAEILVDLEPSQALYDSEVRGIVNDGGFQPGSPDNVSGVPSIGAEGEYSYEKGFTFNIEFRPHEADLSGTRLLIEIGGNSNGSGLYLIQGVPTLLSKQTSSANARPTGFPDTSLNSIGVQSSIGQLDADLKYSFSASWNHRGTLELKTLREGEPDPILDAFEISGTPANWSGNNTLSVATVARNNAGGLASGATIPGSPFNADDALDFTGEVSRALFWNAFSVTELSLTSPRIRGFTITRLPDPGKVRFHWNVSEGDLPNPTTLEIRDADDPENSFFYRPTAPDGFADVSTAITHFTLTASNSTGADQATRRIETESSYAAIVRESGAVAWYRFNGPAGTQLISDSAFNEEPHDGLLQGPSILGESGFLDDAAAFEAGSAVIGTSILNPGTFVAVPADGTPRNGFSVEAVVRRRTGVNGNHVIVSQTDVNGTGRVILGVDEQGKIYTNLPGMVRKEADLILPPDVWSHLVTVVDPGTETPGTAEIRWYLNGLKIGSTLDGKNPGGATFDPNFVLEATEGQWIIGSAKSLSQEFWKGDIDDLAVYSNLLDDPNGDGDHSDSRVGLHRDGWHALTTGILQFTPATQSVITGESTELLIQVGADVSIVTIDHGIGQVPIVNGSATVTVYPTAETTYTLTASGTNGVSTAETTVHYQQLTAPVVLGFEATTLPGTAGQPDQVRLHWAATPGNFTTPFTGRIFYGNNRTSEIESLRGYLDIPEAEATHLRIEITNQVGTTERVALAPAPDTPHSAIIRSAGPAAWFRFNETPSSGLIVDSASNTAPHDGILRNEIAVNQGDRGFIDGAATFEGAAAVITDRIIDPNDEALLAFTLEAIVETNPDGLSENRAILSQQDTPPFSGRHLLTIDDGGTLRSRVGGGIDLVSSDKVPPHAWSHVAAVVDIVENTVSFFIDGQPAGSATTSTFFEPSQGAWVIGSNKALDGVFWRGKIDDLIVYSRGLTQAEILAHRDAWWEQTTGLLFAGPDRLSIESGETANLLVKVGADVSQVSLDPGENLDLEGSSRGSIRIPLNPTRTTLYTVTYQTSAGTYTHTFTVAVNGTDTGSLEVTGHRIEDGFFIIEYRGSPNTSYRVTGSTDLISFSANLGTTTTDTAGNGSARIQIDPEKSAEFFRIETTD